jgi:hypothetical protein
MCAIIFNSVDQVTGFLLILSVRDRDEIFENLGTRRIPPRVLLATGEAGWKAALVIEPRRLWM